MPKTTNTIIPFGNNRAVTAGLPSLSDKNRTKQCAQIIHNTKTYWATIRKAIVDVRLLAIDMSYQRVEARKLNTLIAQFDKNDMDDISVSYRDNAFIVYDGQHRVLAAIANGIYELPCSIRTDMTKADEAKKFSKQKDCSTPLYPIDVYKADIQWGEPTALWLKELLEKYGLTARKSQKKNQLYTLTCVATARKILADTDLGYECLDWILSVFQNAKWTIEYQALTNDFVQAMAEVYKEGINKGDLDTRTTKLTDTFMLCKPIQTRDFLTGYIRSERRRNATEGFKDISIGKCTANMITNNHFSRTVSTT